MFWNAWDTMASAVSWLIAAWSAQPEAVKALLLILACLLTMYQAGRSERLTVALYISAFGFFAAAAATFYAAFIGSPML